MSAPRPLHRPIFGGVFQSERYVLSTVPCVSRGLHAVRFMVMEPASGAVISVAEQKVDALMAARKVIRAGAAVARDRERAEAAHAGQQALWPDVPELAAAPMRRRPVSKRRRDVFVKSAGQCHYCGTTLTLDGRWHVEHMMPRALGGPDELPNLVASCVPCNQAKGGRTAIEFVADPRRRE